MKWFTNLLSNLKERKNNRIALEELSKDLKKRLKKIEIEIEKLEIIGEYFVENSGGCLFSPEEYSLVLYQRKYNTNYSSDLYFFQLRYHPLIAYDKKTQSFQVEFLEDLSNKLKKLRDDKEELKEKYGL